MKNKKKLYKIFKKFFIPSLLVIAITLILVQSAFAEAGEDFWGTFYNDGTWEYDYGFMHYYDNGDGDPYYLYTDTIPNDNHWTDADERINFRDRAKNTHHGDNRGWIYWKTEWQNYDNINKYKGTSGNGSYGYSEYTSNDYDPIEAYGALPYGGVQDGGSKIYWGQGVWNRYRRAALKLYYRDLPTPWHGQQYISGAQSSGNYGKVGDSNYYQDGTTFWIQPNKAFKLRSWAYDLYSNDYGQQAQYAANVRSTTFFLHNDTLSYAVARQVDHKYNTTSVYGGRNTHPSSVISSNTYWKGYEYGTREVYDGLYRNGNGAEITLSLPNQLSLKVMTDHLNKQGRWTSNSTDGWNSTFYTPTGAATRLNTDGDAPTITNAYVENKTSTGFDIVVTGVNDNGGSGVKQVTLGVWSDANGTDDITWHTVATSGGDIRFHVNKSEHNNEMGMYRAEIYPVDNLLNQQFRKSLTADIVNPNMPDLTVTNDIVGLSNDTSVTGNLKDGQNYRIKTTIRNIGEINASTFAVSVARKDKQTYSTFNVNGLAAGASATYYTQFTATSIYGEWADFVSAVDINNVIAEKLETNNKDSTSKYIEGGSNTKPTAVISGLTPIPKGTNPGINSSQSTPNDIGDSIFVSDWGLSLDGGSTYQSSSLSGVNGIKDLLPNNEKFKSYGVSLSVCDDGIAGRYNKLWSDTVYKDFVVYNPNTKPTSNFNIAAEVTENQDIGFVDLSSPVDSWDSIKTREYSIDGGVTWTATKPTVLSLTSLPANQASKDFNIGFKVTDTGHIYSGSLTSTSVFKTVRVYRNNNKPIALFTVTPSIAKINSTLTYSDTSYDPDPWGTITERVWEYRKVKDISGNPVIDTWKLGKPTVINDYGFFEIRLKVKDNGNGILDPLWSDYYTQVVKISKSDLIIKEMKILDINNDTEPTYLLQGNSYRIKATVKNIGEVSSEGNIIRFSNSSNVEIDRANVPTLLASQETSIIVDYTQEAGGANYIINAKVDNENVVAELREDNNTSSVTKSLYIKDLITDNIIIKDASGNAVTSMIQGHSYSVNVTNKNSGTIAITEGFNIGLKINDVLQGARKNIAGGILVGASSVEGKWTLTPPLNISAYQAYKLDGIADVDSTVWETYENNNIKTTNINAYYQNLKPTLIDIVGENDDTSITQLQQGKKYRVKFIVKNDGQTNIGAFAINVRETNSNLSIGTLNCSGLNANTSTTTHYMTFTANGRGNMNFEVFADSGFVIKESNEDDNKLSTARTGFRLNLKTTSIDIVGRNDTITKNPLTQNIQYRAAITIANDGDIDISNSVVGLYENTSNVVTSATKLGTTNLTIAKGETKTVYVPFIPQNRGARTFIGVADDSKVVDESDELDNEAYTNRTVNKVNIKAVIMDIQDTNGVTQTLLQKGKNYNAKIQLINDGDANIGAFNLGLYDNNVQIGSLPISSLPKAATPTVYTIAFIPQNGGSRTFEAFADDKLQIEESNETDNKLQSVLSVNIIQLINYRITSMVNPPKVYSYPIDINRMPVEVKSGYNVTFQIDVIGIADSVTADFTDSSGLNNKTVNFKKVIDIDPFYSVWEATVNTDMNTPLNTIIYSTVVGKRETEVYNYNTSNNWGGATLLIKGSALEDFNINRIY